MGRKDRSVATYGRHRQRVVASDVWSSDEDKKKHVFSFSNGSMLFSSTDSDGSLLESTKKAPKKTGNTKSTKKKVNSMKDRGVNKENRYNKKITRSTVKEKKFTVFSESDKDSIGGDSLALSDKPLTRRVLRDRNVPTDSSVSSIPSPRPRRRLRPPRNKDANKDSASYNFSEFDDYSLCVSSESPPAHKNRATLKKGQSGIETSTPFRGTMAKKKHIGEEIKDADLSLIDLVVDSPVVSDSSRFQGSPHPSEMSNVTSYAASPSLIVQDKKDNDSDSQISDLKDCRVELSRLENSINSMHISKRGRDLSRHASINSTLSSFQQSQSLFDSPMGDSRQSDSSRNLTDSSHHISSYTFAKQLQKMRESFTRSKLSSSPFLAKPPNTRSSFKHEEPEKRSISLRSRDIHGSVSSNDSEGSDICEDEGSVDEEEGSCSEDEDAEDDLSDIFEDEEQLSEEESSQDEDEEDENKESSSEETRYILTEKGTNGEWEEDEMSLNISDIQHNMSDQEMDMSACDSPAVQKSVYYSADSDGSLYRTAEERIPHMRLRNKHLNHTAEDANLSRSFVEMLTPKKKCRSAPPPTPRSKLLTMCEQRDPVSFSDLIPDSMMRQIVKIGEGVYGEVFRAQRDGKSVAIKIIPIEGDFEVNDEPQKTFAEILPEVVISKELSGLRQGEKNMTPSFCEVISAACVKGKYPDHLLKQWDIYDKKRKSENDRPDVFDDNQLFVMFEFADGGSDLESFMFPNPWQARSVLQQVTVSLAVAEEELEFEHRDLHIGNVLVRPTVADVTVEYCLADGSVEVDSHGVTVSIIDFTLSRLRKDGCTVFCDLAKDDALFEGSGDYQFDIYRNMKEENKNEWEMFNPHTNIHWLHYLCDKLLKVKKYKRNGREDREAMRYLRQFQNEVLSYHSAKHFVLESELFQT